MIHWYGDIRTVSLCNINVTGTCQKHKSYVLSFTVVFNACLSYILPKPHKLLRRTEVGSLLVWRSRDKIRLVGDLYRTQRHCIDRKAPSQGIVFFCREFVSQFEVPNQKPRNVHVGKNMDIKLRHSNTVFMAWLSTW